ncbi:hypothetical protein GCM10023213_48210 [Prosthecobacter algae]|uniref:Uncharacterized protein n=1 Tax=Prosthecobacter algae TaxID=1144682 RepID=A0ABP9PR04_9BACT
MTWQHLQQLRATAQSSIRQHLGEAQPQGGQGAIVQGGSIALLPDRREPGQPRTAPWTLAIFATIDYEWPGVDSDGRAYSRSGSYPVDVAAWMPRQFPILRRSYLLESSQFFELTPDEETGAWHKRVSTVKFEARALPGDRGPHGQYDYADSYYRIPVEITVGHVVATLGSPPDIVKTHKLTLRRNGATYTPKPVQMDEFYELRVLDVKRI